MENLLFIDRQPLLRLGLKLLVESSFPKVRFYEASCRYAPAGSFSCKTISIAVLGFDPDRERIDPIDILRIQDQFPHAKLIVYAGNIPEQKIQSFFELGIAAYLSKQASTDEVLQCLSLLM